MSDKLARERFTQVKQAVKQFAADYRGKIHDKERRRQKGDNQYERVGEGASDIIQVNEGRARFEVNLSDSLDIGLFLDHRPVRALLAELGT